jgi:hypothetical protein
VQSRLFSVERIRETIAERLASAIPRSIRSGFRGVRPLRFQLFWTAWQIGLRREEERLHQFPSPIVISSTHVSLGSSRMAHIL